jgi:hypothetical protein
MDNCNFSYEKNHYASENILNVKVSPMALSSKKPQLRNIEQWGGIEPTQSFRRVGILEGP